MLSKLMQRQQPTFEYKTNIHDNNSGLFFVSSLEYWTINKPNKLNNLYPTERCGRLNEVL